MPDWTGTAICWIIYIVACIFMAKRLGYESQPGFLKTLGWIFIFALVGPLVLLYWAFTESPNERRLRELERRVGTTEPGKPANPETT
jgi:hypothetical protein